MKMKKILVLLLVLAIVSPLFAGGRSQADGTPAPRPQVLSLATATLGGTYYIVGAALGEAITKRVPHLTVNAIISGGSTGNPLMLHRDEAELGITNYFSAWNAIQGNRPFEHPLDIAGIAPLQFSQLHIMVMANSDMHTFRDLRGKRVNLGPAAGGGALFFRELLPFWGLSESDFTFSFTSYVEGSEALRDGRVDVNTPNGAAPLETVSSLAAFGAGVRLISLEAENMARVTAANPHYGLGVIPAGTYRGINQDVHTGGIRDILVVRRSMDDETVYQITRAIFESLERLRPAHPSLHDLGFANYNHSLVPLHPGALRFYRERNIPLR